MSKLLSTLTAGALALTLSGFAFAQQDQAKEEQLKAELAKCESLQGADKTKCIEAAKKKAGQM